MNGATKTGRFGIGQLQKLNLMNKHKEVLVAFIVFMLFLYVMVFFAPTSCMNFFAPIENRELSFLEIAQVLLLLLTVRLAWIQLKKNIGKNIQISLLWLILMVVLLVVVLEETDYGLHYYDFLSGNASYYSNINGTFRNVHNQGNNNTLIKTIILIAQIIFFGVFPLFNRSFGKKVFNKKYAIYFWVITFATLLLYTFYKNYFTTDIVNALKISQLFAETRELGYYLLLLVFISVFKQEFGSFHLSRSFDE
jgi:hypothetical protein